MKKSPTQPVRVYGFPIDVCHVKGDKIIIHKCDIDKAIKTIRNCSDPYDYGEYDVGKDAGKIEVLRELLDCIRRGKELERDLKERQYFNRAKREYKESLKKKDNGNV